MCNLVHSIILHTLPKMCKRFCHHVSKYQWCRQNGPYRQSGPPKGPTLSTHYHVRTTAILNNIDARLLIFFIAFSVVHTHEFHMPYPSVFSWHIKGFAILNTPCKHLKKSIKYELFDGTCLSARFWRLRIAQRCPLAG